MDDPRDIGALRKLPASIEQPIRVNTSRRRVWIRFVDSGHATSETRDEGLFFKRTPKGDATIMEFDACLSADHLRTLALAAGRVPPKSFPPPPGASDLIHAGLIVVGVEGLRPTPAGVQAARGSANRQA